MRVAGAGGRGSSGFGHCNAELPQFPEISGQAPAPIRSREVLDRRPGFLADCGPTRLPPAEPRPVLPKPPALPRQDRRGLEDQGRLPPAPMPGPCVTEWFLADDVDAGGLRHPAVFAMQRGNHQQIDEILPLGVQHAVQPVIDTRLREKLVTPGFHARLGGVPQRNDLHFGNALPAAQDGIPRSSRTRTHRRAIGTSHPLRGSCGPRPREAQRR